MSCGSVPPRKQCKKVNQEFTETMEETRVAALQSLDDALVMVKPVTSSGQLCPNHKSCLCAAATAVKKMHKWLAHMNKLFE